MHDTVLSASPDVAASLGVN